MSKRRKEKRRAQIKCKKKESRHFERIVRKRKIICRRNINELRKRKMKGEKVELLNIK